eukprot:scaffold48951_cov92-Cyclotella_meneghiniana.AAC.5
MTKEELTQWKINERRKRKRARGRERKMAEDQKMRELRKELTELEGMVGELDTGVEVYVKPVVVVLEETAAVADADVKSSSDTATIEMEDVKSGFIAEDSLSGFSEALLKSSPEENYTDDSKLINNQVTLNSTTNGYRSELVSITERRQKGILRRMFSFSGFGSESGRGFGYGGRTSSANMIQYVRKSDRAKLGY